MSMATKTENTKSKIKNTKNDGQAKKGNSVPFDPGFAPYVLSFMETYEYLNAEVRKFKNIVQRKMKYRSYEQPLFKLLNNITSFYFGGMLYGAYLSCYYSENPMEIEGNTFLGEKVVDIINIPVFEEVRSVDKFLSFHNSSPFSTKKTEPEKALIMKTYIEFIEKNKYFTQMKTTADIKIPNDLKFVKKYTKEELEELYQTMLSVIKSEKIEDMTQTKYFQQFISKK